MFLEELYLDREFENPRKIITGRSTLNMTTESEHDPEIESQIRFIKERAIPIWITLPLNKVPGRIIIETILFVVTWINDFPPIGGISQTYSPRTIMKYFTL